VPPFLRGALRVGVIVLVAAVTAVTAAQQMGTAGPWWLELSRYLPFPMLLAPALLAAALALPLGRGWLAAAGAATLAVLVVSMGFEWHLRGDRDGAFRIMTYNAKAAAALERPGGVAALIAEVAAHRPDVLLMQDANGVRHWPPDDRQALVAGLHEVHAQGQYFIASRFPARCVEAQAESSIGPLTYVRCSVEPPAGAFDLITVHFESPRSGLVAARHEGLQGRDSWERNHEIRLAQSRALAGAIGTFVRPLVVAGDLNAPDSSAVLGILRAVGLVDAFAQGGRGWGYTYGHTLRPAFSFLRIDHVLASAEFDVVDAFVGGADASDHRPVLADLRLPRR